MNKKTPNEYSYEDIKVGQTVEFEQEISEDMVNRYAELTGDYNPLHVDKEYAKTTKFKENIVHGMFTASFFSTLVGMYCPGKKNLYLKQELNFKRPLKLNQKIKVHGEIIKKVDSLKLITIKTTITDIDDNVVIDGEAIVRVE